MKYEEFKQINNILRTKLNKDRGVHIDSKVETSDKDCQVSHGGNKSVVYIKNLILDVFNGIIYISNPSALNSWNFNKGFTYVYVHHGSKEGIVGNIEPHSRVTCDFGDAFYTASDKGFAFSSAVRKDGEIGYYYKFICDLDNLNVYKFKSLELWALYTARNRGYIDNIEEYIKLKQLCEEIDSYDVVVGLIADDRSAYVINNFLNNSITDKCMYACMRYFNLGYQYVFKTVKACNALRLVEQYTIQGSEYKTILHDNNVRIGTSEKIVSDLESQLADSGLRFRQILRRYK